MWLLLVIITIECGMLLWGGVIMWRRDGDISISDYLTLVTVALGAIKTTYDLIYLEPIGKWKIKGLGKILFDLFVFFIGVIAFALLPTVEPVFNHLPFL
jgi:hypothetical protein